MKLARLIFAFSTAWLGIAAASEKQRDPTEKPVRLPVMTWYHPLLEPDLADITLLCTIVKVEKAARKLYGNSYWNVVLRIDERIYVEERYEKRLENVRLIESGDFRRRKIGERIVLFAGGEPYDGDDFLLPAWKGTSTDLGIVLFPPDDLEADANERLLTGLRRIAKGAAQDADFLMPSLNSLRGELQNFSFEKCKWRKIRKSFKKKISVRKSEPRPELPQPVEEDEPELGELAERVAEIERRCLK